MAILDGKARAAKLRKDIKADAQRFQDKHGRPPGLDVIVVGDDPASAVYVKGKEKACTKVGFRSKVHRFPNDASEQEIILAIKELNHDETVDGILLQLPLPKPLRASKIIDFIDPLKDVDGLHPSNLGKLLTGQKGIVPCTPLGCMMLLDDTNIKLAGLNAVVVGRSNLVGKPLPHLLLQKNATVTICHSHTKALAHIVADADILVAAIGRPETIKSNWIKTGAIVIDVGINRVEGEGGKSKLVGDVDFAQAVKVAGSITPVPGGVGPMTIACLLRNTLRAARAIEGLDQDTVE